MPDTVGPDPHEPTSLRGIANKARADTRHRFRDLYRCLDANLLRTCWDDLNKAAASGVDHVTAEDYAANLQANIEALAQRLKAQRYRAKLVRRCYMPKANGKERPIGIPALEDKLVQLACAKLLTAIYEQDFLDISYGYRPKRCAMHAVQDLTFDLQYGRFGYIVEADVKGFLDTASYCTPCHERSLNKPCWTSNTLIYKPVLLPERTWTAEISPRFTRCNTVWRDTPRSLVASNIGTSPSGACSTKRLRTSSLRRMHHGAPGVICSPAMKPSETHRCTVEGAIWRISAAFAIVTNSPSVGAVPGSNR